MLGIGAFLEVAAGTLKAVTLAQEASRDALQFQMGADKQLLEQLKAENEHLRKRLAVYEQKNAQPGSGGSDTGQL